MPSHHIATEESHVLVRSRGCWCSDHPGRTRWGSSRRVGPGTRDHHRHGRERCRPAARPGRGRDPSMGLGALSRDDGRYAVVVPGARISGQTVTLIARRLGYKSASAQITLSPGGVTHDFTLAANPLQLGEVVVTGAGTSTETEKLGNVRN